MNVLSAFDGISCGQLALIQAGVNYDKYYASETDKRACAVTQRYFPDTIQLGDVAKVNRIGLPVIDLLIGGSPCQGFSFAGKGLNFEDERSKLFFEFVRLLEELRAVNPEIKFLLENVKMKRWQQDVISGLLKCEPKQINSGHFSPQKRKRLYWTNISIHPFPEPDTRTIKDVLENPDFVLVTRGGHYLKDHEIERAKHKYAAKVWKSGKRMGNMKFPDAITNKSRSLPATVIKAARETIHIQDTNGIRILTTSEYEQLQGLPHCYTLGVSDTTAYELIGNGWNVPTVAHIFKGLRPSLQQEQQKQ